MTKITNNTDTSTNKQTPMTHEEAMALPKQQFIDRCSAWLNEFNNGNQLKLDDPTKCPLHIWVVHNHQACGKDLVGGIVNCPICNLPMCPNCSSHNATQFSRVTGYIQDVAGFNAGKRQELVDRKKHDTFG